MYLSPHPRVTLAHLPTPFHPLPRLSAALAGPKIWIKRDDCTGLAGGGNKTRKLEFLIGAALATNADAIITQGAVQSNHVRQTAAAAAAHGLPCHALLEDRIASPHPNANHNGNVLLNHLLGAHLSRHPAGTDMNAAMQQTAADLIASGTAKNPYIIPGGGSNPTGALGYVNAAAELATQATAMGLPLHHIIHATGSAGTQAGLATGLHAINADIPLLGISVRADRATQERNVLTLAQQTATHLNLPTPIPAHRIRANDDYIGAGYGLPAASTIEAIHLTAATEGILLDPVYSGKGMAGLIALVRQGKFAKSDNIAFIHTGGAQALPGYLHDFNPQGGKTP